MAILGYTLLAFGLLAALYGDLRFLVAAYNRSLWWFFGCLFVPFVSWFFLLLNFRVARKPFFLSWAGVIIASAGSLLLAPGQ